MPSNTKRESSDTPRPTASNANGAQIQRSTPNDATSDEFRELEREPTDADLMDVGIDIEEDVYDADETSLQGRPWKPPSEEDDGGSVSPEELGEQFLRGAAQQERRTKIDDTEPDDDVDLLSDTVHEASLFDHNHDPLAREDLPEVIADETDADAHHRIRRVAAKKVEAEGSATSSDAEERQVRETAAPPSRQQRSAAKGAAETREAVPTAPKRSARRN